METWGFDVAVFRVLVFQAGPMIRTVPGRFQSFWSLVRGKPENRRTVQLENRRIGGWMMTIRHRDYPVFGPLSSVFCRRSSLLTEGEGLPLLAAMLNYPVALCW